MSFAEKFRHFLIFLLLSFVTFGLYPVYFMVSRQQEQNEILKEIRESLEAKE